MSAINGRPSIELADERVVIGGTVLPVNGLLAVKEGQQ